MQIIFVIPILFGSIAYVSDSIGVLLAIMGFCIIGLIVGGTVQYNKIRKTGQISNDLGVSYDGSTCVLSLKKRSTQLEEIIKIKASKDVNIKYEPLVYHVGAVSVGGITTGGTYTTGGYSYVSSVKNNGKCFLIYDSGVDGNNMIRSIKLTPELFAIAKHSAISEYLDEQNSSIIINGQLSKRDMDLMWNSNFDLNYVNNVYPTKEKAFIIMDWITGRI